MTASNRERSSRSNRRTRIPTIVAALAIILVAIFKGATGLCMYSFGPGKFLPPLDCVVHEMTLQLYPIRHSARVLGRDKYCSATREGIEN